MNDDVKRGPGRPPQYVQYKGQIVVGLSGPKPPLESSPEEGRWADGRYYSTHNDPRDGSRVYFGNDLAEAVTAFRKWQRDVKIWRRENDG